MSLASMKMTVEFGCFRGTSIVLKYCQQYYRNFELKIVNKLTFLWSRDYLLIGQGWSLKSLLHICLKIVTVIFIILKFPKYSLDFDFETFNFVL